MVSTAVEKKQRFLQASELAKSWKVGCKGL
jgi:hypothetical protein